MADRDTERRGGISLQTLVVASLASGAAALITSQLWEEGRVLTAVFTPIIVTLVSELLHRPVERISSATVRRQVPRAAGAGEPARRARARETVPPLAPGEGARRESTDAGAEAPAGPNGHDRAGTGRARGDGDNPPAGEVPPIGDGRELGPRRVYSKRRPVRLRRVLAAGLAAFVIGAAILTVPELLAGEALGGGGGRTTLFGGDASSGGESGDGGREAPAGTGGESQGAGDGEDPAPGSGEGPAPGGSEPPPAPDGGGSAPAPPEQPAP